MSKLPFNITLPNLLFYFTIHKGYLFFSSFFFFPFLKFMFFIKLINLPKSLLIHLKKFTRNNYFKIYTLELCSKIIFFNWYQFFFFSKICVLYKLINFAKVPVNSLQKIYKKYFTSKNIHLNFVQKYFFFLFDMYNLKRVI